jgi:hypothetical protein
VAGVEGAGFSSSSLSGKEENVSVRSNPSALENRLVMYALLVVEDVSEESTVGLFKMLEGAAEDESDSTEVVLSRWGGWWGWTTRVDPLGDRGDVGRYDASLDSDCEADRRCPIELRNGMMRVVRGQRARQGEGKRQR